MNTDEEIDDASLDEISLEQRDVEFKALLDELEESPREIATRLRQLGDHRSVATILRSIQRMRSGEVGVAGEMRVLVTLFVQNQRRRNKQYAAVVWKTDANGVVSATVDGFRIRLAPQSRARWSISLENVTTGFCPTWPTWQPNLTAAKKRALMRLGDAQAELDALEHEQNALQA